MNRHPSYKPSGVKWLGEIPSHWEMLPGLAVFNENKEKNSDLSINTVLSLSYGKIVVKKDIDEGLVPAEYNTYQIVHPGYIIIRCTDLQNDKVSLRTGLVKDDGIITGAYLGLVTSKKHNSSYIHYFLHAWDITKEIYRHGNGLRQSLSWLDLRRLPILIPPLEEQSAIAAYLDTAIAKIDAAIAQQQKMIDLLNERKQIIINRAVTKGLNPNAKMKDSGVEWIGEVPEGWEVRKLKYLLRQITVPSSSLNKFGLENIESGTGKFIKTNTEYEGNGIQFEKGDILYGKLRPYLKKVFVAEESGNAVGDFFVFRPNDKVEGRYMQIVLLSQTLTDEINSSTYGAKMPRVSINFMGGLYIPLPSLDEQEVIVESIHKDCKPIDAAIDVANKQISLLQERKQIIINEVVTGRVRVI